MVVSRRSFESPWKVIINRNRAETCVVLICEGGFSVSELTCGAAASFCRLVFEMQEELHNNASELPAVRHRRHLSSGYSHSPSVAS